jgi:uncharacterized protein (TIGR00299 family) protein
MRIAYLDCSSGASGNMLLAALLGAGWSQAALHRVAVDLGIPMAIHTTSVNRRGVPALHVDIRDEQPMADRPYPRLAELLAGSRIEEPVRSEAAAILRRIAEVESVIHGVPIDQVHLHELGGLDTLVDVVGVLAGMRALHIDRVVASPVNLGRGSISMSHGTVPAPAPATAAFLEGMPVYAGAEVEIELLTPTGAALLSRLVSEWGPLPPMRIERIGAGAGTDDPPHANVLRLFVGEALETARGNAAGPRTERLVMLEASIDDMNPQLLPHVMDRLFDAGALDVMVLPGVMKKGRPGHLVRVLASPESSHILRDLLLSETTTIGVRAHEVARHAAGRRTVNVQTEFGPVPVKVAYDAGGILNVSPEFDACRTLAERHRVPLKRVLAAAQQAAASLLLEARHP